MKQQVSDVHENVSTTAGITTAKEIITTMLQCKQLLREKYAPFSSYPQPSSLIVHGILGLQYICMISFYYRTDQ